MRAMRTKLDKSTNASRKVFRAYRDRLIDRWDARLSEAKRANEEELLARTEKAELIAAGVSASEAQKQANAMAASMVDAATETKQTMRELADGKLTDQAAEEKRRRIKTMLAEARSGKANPKARSSRRLDALLGQLLGSKFRFACAAVLLLAVGMWVSSNRQSLENYWQQTKTTVSNISIEGGIAGAAETAKDTLSKSAELKWTPVLGGLVTQTNVIYVALAGLLMAAGTLFYGWKKSLIFAPLTLLILAIPIFM
jgi:eukaryotic-like serine/threonine-protein kinase